MKLKYYLRGIAVGIIFTIVILTLTGAMDNQAMSDSEIIHAAKLLGMVEGKEVNISGIAPTPTAVPTESATPTPEENDGDGNGDAGKGDVPFVTEAPTSTVTPTPTLSTVPTVTPTPTPVPTKVPEVTPTPVPTEVPKATPTPEPTKAPTPTPTPTKAPESSQGTGSKDKVTLKIEKGMYSEAISEAAYKAGLVKSAADFNKYLNDNGYASNIHIGTYQFSKDATYYEIATAITNKSW